MEDVARARYMTMQTTRVKPGRGIDYIEYLKGQVAAREKANLDMHTAVYQAVSGAAPNTFVDLHHRALAQGMGRHVRRGRKRIRRRWKPPSAARKRRGSSA